ncbi:hypothetical protein RhiirC2_709550 [Rhizophagus irregularis]|uniref:Uncharacterized protein n=1 Tax=Rhizophagus irregularis TaxID=588596 RepID=A0A2N1NI82_9GLOM|nr:hypothetical protein RhiirC2_709550 [Rhizophagus irregularis]
MAMVMGFTIGRKWYGTSDMTESAKTSNIYRRPTNLIGTNSSIGLKSIFSQCNKNNIASRSLPYNFQPIKTSIAFNLGNSNTQALMHKNEKGIDRDYKNSVYWYTNLGSINDKYTNFAISDKSTWHCDKNMVGSSNNSYPTTLIGAKTVIPLIPRRYYHRYVDPEDVLITDVTRDDLFGKISDLGGVMYLSDAKKELDKVDGFMVEPYSRCFGLMTVKLNEKIKNVYFLIDTGSPQTFICPDLLNEFKISTPNSGYLDILVVKRKITASISPSPSAYSYLNLLGTDFMSKYKAKLYADFAKNKFNLKFEL